MAIDTMHFEGGEYDGLAFTVNDATLPWPTAVVFEAPVGDVPDGEEFREFRYSSYTLADDWESDGGEAGATYEYNGTRRKSLIAVCELVQCVEGGTSWKLIDEPRNEFYREKRPGVLFHQEMQRCWYVAGPEGDSDFVADIVTERGPRGDANAKLMAAAPVLLVALTDARDTIAAAGGDTRAIDDAIGIAIC
jgi:hypothetical protein